MSWAGAAWRGRLSVALRGLGVGWWLGWWVSGVVGGGKGDGGELRLH